MSGDLDFINLIFGTFSLALGSVSLIGLIIILIDETKKRKK